MKNLSFEEGTFSASNLHTLTAAGTAAGPAFVAQRGIRGYPSAHQKWHLFNRNRARGRGTADSWRDLDILTRSRASKWLAT